MNSTTQQEASPLNPKVFIVGENVYGELLKQEFGYALVTFSVDGVEWTEYLFNEEFIPVEEE